MTAKIDPYKEVKNAALERANEIRKKLGLPDANMLEKGTPSDALSCPITNTIKSGTDIEQVSTGSIIEVHVKKPNGRTIIRRYKHTKGSSDFIEMFDNYAIPELDSTLGDDDTND